MAAAALRDTCRTVCAIALHRKTKTNTSPDPNRYKRRCPDPNARIQKFIHYMTTTVLQNSMRIEFAHTHLHTTRHSFTRNPLIEHTVTADKEKRYRKRKGRRMVGTGIEERKGKSTGRGVKDISSDPLQQLDVTIARFPLPELTGDRFLLPVNTSRQLGQWKPGLMVYISIVSARGSSQF